MICSSLPNAAVRATKPSLGTGLRRDLAASRIVACTVALVVEAVLGSPRATIAETGPKVRYDEAGLTVHADHVPLDDVLAAITRETGIEIDGEPLDRRDVSKQFESVPLALALRRVVGRQNFILYYGSDGEPERLQLLGVPLPPPTPARTRGLNAFELLAKHPPVALQARLAEALGAKALSPHRLLPAFRHPDFIVRTEAAQTIVRAVEGDPALLDATRSLNATQLTRLVSNQSGTHAAEVAMTLYRAARDARLKATLAAVLATLRRTPA
jgi:hypothetical protein